MTPSDRLSATPVSVNVYVIAIYLDVIASPWRCLQPDAVTDIHVPVTLAVTSCAGVRQATVVSLRVVVGGRRQRREDTAAGAGSGREFARGRRLARAHGRHSLLAQQAHASPEAGPSSVSLAC